jgi:hypothetical protein
MLGAAAKLKVTKQPKGVTISITSDDAKVVARVQKMAEAMRLMHEAGTQQQGSGDIDGLCGTGREWLSTVAPGTTHASLCQAHFRLRTAANGAMSGFSVCRNPLLAKFSTGCSSRETSTSRRLLRPYARPATSVSSRISLRLASIGSPGGAQTST